MNAASRKIQFQYDRAAHWYDPIEGILEALGLRRLRRGLLGSARGRILEVAAGTGRNLPFYNSECRLTAVDFSSGMLQIAQHRAMDLGMSVQFSLMDAENLAFPDQTFDAVISSLSTCTFFDPVAALREMARVCHPEGRILLLEHGRSDRERLGRWQDRYADAHAKQLGCRWNREPIALIRQAGLRTLRNGRTFFGILHAIEAQPPLTVSGEGCEGRA